MASGNKKAKARKPAAQPRFAPRETPRQSTNDLCPVFGFCYLASGFRISDCQQPAKAALADKLQELSQLTWSQIVQAPRTGMGTETIARDSVVPAIPPSVTPDVRLLSWRFGGGSRIIGYREDQVFHVVWVDPNHSVYAG